MRASSSTTQRESVMEGKGGWSAGLRRVPAWNALSGRVRRQLLMGGRTPQSEEEAQAALAYARRTTTYGAAFVLAVVGAAAGAAGWLVSAALMGRGVSDAVPGAVAFAVTWLVVGTLLGRRRARRLQQRAERFLEDDDLRRG